MNTMIKYPSFKALHGHDPVAGKDYDPDDSLCQDDYEFFMGIGDYSDDAIKVEDIIALLDRHYELIYVDYRENLEDHLDLIQAAIQKQSKDPLYEEIDEWYWEVQIDGLDYVIGELKKEIMQTYNLDDDEDADAIYEQFKDQIEEEIYNRDESDPLHDLLRNTSDPVAFYDTGLEINEPYDSDDIDNSLEQVKETLHIESDQWDDKLRIMLSQASYGGRLVVYFSLDIDTFLDVQEANTIHFSNPMIAVIDNYNGSGDNTDLPGHKFSLPLNLENLFLDKTIKYNYTYEVCGMISGWCNCTRVSLSKEDNVTLPETSGLHDLMDREAQYIQTYKEGGCTLGDTDIYRHRGVYYLNEYPCGSHCPNCGQFWID